jgi:hypothetical protein
MEATSMVHDEVDIYVISFQEVLTVDNVSAVRSEDNAVLLFIFLFLLFSFLCFLAF